MENNNFVIICKELSKNSTKGMVYKLYTENITPNLLTILKLRHKFNEDLRYYVTKEENSEFVIRLLEQFNDDAEKSFNKANLFVEL